MILIEIRGFGSFQLIRLVQKRGMGQTFLQRSGNLLIII